MPRWKNTIRRTLLYSAGLVLALVLLSPFILPSLLNSHAVRQRLAKELHEVIGLPVSPDNVRLALTPFPAIQLEDFPISVGPVSARIRSLNIKLDLMDLLNRQLTIDSVQIDHAFLRYSQGQSAGSPAKLSPGAGRTDFLVPPTDLAGKLLRLLPSHQGNIRVSIADMKSDDFQDMDAQLLISKKEEKILVHSTIRGIDVDGGRLDALGRGLDLPFDRVRIPKATLVLNLDNQGTLQGEVTLTAPKVTCANLAKGPLTAQNLTFNISLSRDKRKASLAPGQITYPAARIGVEFEQDIRSGKTALTFKGTKVDIAQAREVCLPLLKGFEVPEKLFDILRAGTARTILVGFKAPALRHLFHPENLIISGRATAARVRIPKTPLIAEKVGASVTMARGVLHIEPTRGAVAGTTLRDGVLDVNLIHPHHVPFSGSFSLDARLETLPKSLARLLPGTRLAQEMALISTISGTAKARLDLDMPLGKDLEVTVKARAIKASGEYERVPLPIQVDAGTFTYEDNRVTLDNFSGTLGRNPVRGLTALATVEDLPQLKLTADSGHFFIQDLMLWIKSHAPAAALIAPARDLTGELTLDSLAISGPMFLPSQWTFSAAGSGENIKIDFDGHPGALDQVSGRFQISEARYRITDLTARANDLHWLEFAFDRDTLDSFCLPVAISKSRVDKTDRMFVHGKLKFPDGPTALFDLAGSDARHLNPTLLAIKDEGLSDLLVIPYTDPAKPKYSVDGRLNSRTLQNMLVSGSALHNALKTLTGGDILALYTDAASDIHLNSSKINIDRFLDKKKRGTQAKKTETTRKKSRPLLAQKRLFFKGKELIYQNRSFTDVEAIVRFGPDATRVDISQAGLCGLKGTGQIIIPHDSAEPEISTWFSVQSREDTNIADMTSCLFKSRSAINGTYTLSMDLTGRGNRDNIVHSQQGTLKFEANQGRIFKATILSRLLSVINILDVDLKQDGFAYKRFTVDAQIKDSVVQLNKCYIDAENMAVIASGWLDPLKDKMDITFLVAPFKTIDSLIKAIPVVNTILSGRLVSLPARASGSISDPKVVPLAPSAVGKGLINMLTDLVKTPARLFQDEKTP